MRLEIVIGCCFTLSSSAALAQPTGAQAESLFRQGKELMSAGRTAEACAAFEASQKLDPTVSTLINEANCREKNGQLATAWGLFLEAERQTRVATDDPTQKLHQVALDHAAKLEPRLSTLTIVQSNSGRVGGLEILRDGEAVDVGAWNKALPIDGGTYKISARAPGNAEWSTSVTVGPERDTKSVEIPKLKEAALGQGAANPLTSETSETETPATSSDQHDQSRLMPILFGGGAVLALGAALGSGLWAESTNNKANATRDPGQQTTLWHSANDKRYVAEGLAVAGIASVGVAVWAYLRRDAEAAPAIAHIGRARVEPIVAADRTGLQLLGHF